MWHQYGATVITLDLYGNHNLRPWTQQVATHEDCAYLGVHHHFDGISQLNTHQHQGCPGVDAESDVLGGIHIACCFLLCRKVITMFEDDERFKYDCIYMTYGLGGVLLFHKGPSWYPYVHSTLIGWQWPNQKPLNDTHAYVSTKQ